MIRTIGEQREEIEKNIENIVATINETPGVTSDEIYSRLVRNGKITIGKSAVCRYLRTLCWKKAIRRTGVWAYTYYPGDVPFVLPKNERWKDCFKPPVRILKKRGDKNND